MTAVANAIFTAAQFNTHVRDNLLETSPAKATTAGGYFVTSGTNSISQRVMATASVVTAQATSSTTYGDLGTVGPAVTVTTGTSALVFVKCGSSNATAANASFMGYAVSGATTVAASEGFSVAGTTATASAGNLHASAVFLHTGLTAGSNTFTAKYKSSLATSATFRNRDIIVIPF